MKQRNYTTLGKIKKTLIISLFVALFLGAFSVKHALASDFSAMTLPVTYSGHTYNHGIWEFHKDFNDNDRPYWSVTLFNDDAGTYPDGSGAYTVRVGDIGHVNSDTNPLPNERAWNLYGDQAIDDGVHTYWPPVSGSMSAFNCTDGTYSDCSFVGGSHVFRPICPDGGVQIIYSDIPVRDNYGSCSVQPNLEGDMSTRIVFFTPIDGYVASTSHATTSVDFFLHAFINENDIGKYLSIKVVFRNIDQNKILNAPCTGVDIQGTCSTKTFDLFRGVATTSGNFYFSSSTVLSRGNYRVEASLDSATKIGGVDVSFFGGISTVKDHQFIVGSSTWVGNISQNIYKQANEFFDTLPATSTASMAYTCNPLGGSFSIMECLGFLLIPDAKQLNDSMSSARDGILNRVPFGYVTRFISILTNSATSSLPSFTVQFDPSGPLASSTLTFDMQDTIQGGATVLNSIEDPVHHKSVRDIFYPIVSLVVALAVILEIIVDMLGTHKHHNQQKPK